MQSDKKIIQMRFFRLLAACLVALALVGTASRASAGPTPVVTFPAGSLIIPMDVDYQNSGMLKAFGLVYRLLLDGIPVHWVILYGKSFGSTDFTASAIDIRTLAVVTNHGYRGGPFVIDAADGAVARPIIAAWQAGNTTTVHEATTSFTSNLAKTLVAAPTIGVFADGNEDIAFGYLNAAGIPDSTGAPWTAASPESLTVLEVRGPTDTVHNDGALFDEDGDPVLCQFMSMHWAVADRNRPGGEEVVAEVRSFLNFRTHFFAECQAVNAFENAINGRFLTPNGFVISGDPAPVTFLNAWYPFAQLDGPFATVGGSERSYSLPPGDTYKDSDIVMITKAGTTPLTGMLDLWMTGYLDGACPIDNGCTASLGKVSYLGGHRYDTAVPITSNGDTQGTRLFLNSLFEAPCVVEATQPDIRVTKSAPDSVSVPQVTFTFDVANYGESTALSAVLTDALPAGATFVSATGGGTESGGVVTWDLRNLGPGESERVSVTVSLAGYGTYVNSGTVNYLSGVTPRSVDSNAVSVVYGADSDGDGCIDSVEIAMGTDPLDPDTDDDGAMDCVDICPLDYNPLQDLWSDPLNCGVCGNACALPHAASGCYEGGCIIDVCDTGWADCDLSHASGCEFDASRFATDPLNCGGCGVVCSLFQAVSGCSGGGCVVASCLDGWSDCDGVAADGCEYDEGGFATDPANCGGCGVACVFPHATADCASGACILVSCDAGYHDIDGVVGNGCEYACVPSGADVTCDGLDDDCNGIADDAWVSTSRCGTGACERDSVCLLGLETCEPGDPLFEGPVGDATCSDGIDNDCDGLTDGGDNGCLPCAVPADCDDGLFCNGAEGCVDSACVPGADPCEDGDPCTEDLCDEAGRVCSHEDIPACHLDEEAEPVPESDAEEDAAAEQDADAELIEEPDQDADALTDPDPDADAVTDPDHEADPPVEPGPDGPADTLRDEGAEHVTDAVMDGGEDPAGDDTGEGGGEKSGCGCRVVL